MQKPNPFQNTKPRRKPRQRYEEVLVGFFTSKWLGRNPEVGLRRSRSGWFRDLEVHCSGPRDGWKWILEVNGFNFLPLKTSNCYWQLRFGLFNLMPQQVWSFDVLGSLCLLDRFQIFARNNFDLLAWTCCFYFLFRRTRSCFGMFFLFSITKIIRNRFKVVNYLIQASSFCVWKKSLL